MKVCQNILDEVTGSDTESLSFSVQAKPVTYGDGRVFHEYRVVMRLEGKIVGIDDGPRRTHASAADARRAARDRIALLRTHRLFVVPVTAKDIKHGEAHSCESCAISQALWRNQERIGLSKHDFDFRVEPHGFMAEVDGIVLKRDHDTYGPRLITGEDRMPDLVSEGKGKLWVESMYEWTMLFDEWADYRDGGEEAWRGEHERDEDESPPWKPSPCSFVLNLSEMETAV